MYNFGVVMTEEEKKLLNSFETQLRHLIYLHDELKRENAELKKLLENEKLKNEKVQAQYDELEVSYTNLKTATAISLNGSDVKETKLRLSKLNELDLSVASFGKIAVSYGHTDENGHAVHKRTVPKMLITDKIDRKSVV